MATSSDEPIRLPFVGTVDARDYTASTDALIVNGYLEKDHMGDIWINKRFGFNVNIVDPAVSNAATATGAYFWPVAGGQHGLYTITSDGLLRFNGSSTVSNLLTGPNSWWFNQTLGTPSYLYISNGISGYTLDSTGVFAKIVDPNYPATTVPGSAYLDATLYVMDSQARIWGSSALNNPTGWSALNLIQAQVEPDAGVAIAKQLIYVVAFKQWTTEFFYDAGNPGGNQGTSLLPVQNAKLPMGCAAPYSIQSIDDDLYFIGSNKLLGPSVYRISGLKLTKISSPAIDRILGGLGYAGNQLAYQSISGQFRLNGHTFYTIRVLEQTNSLTPARQTTYVYDVTMNQWYLWSSSVATVTGQAASQELPLINFVTDVALQQNYCQCDITGLAGSIMSFSIPQGITSPGFTDQIQPNVSAVVTDIITPNFEGGTKRKKYLAKMFLHADQRSAGSVLIRWSDDDYKTWSNWTTVNLQDFATQMTQLGTFRKRAFQFRHQGTGPFRMREPELELLLGST